MRRIACPEFFEAPHDDRSSAAGATTAFVGGERIEEEKGRIETTIKAMEGLVADQGINRLLSEDTGKLKASISILESLLVELEQASSLAKRYRRNEMTVTVLEECQRLASLVDALIPGDDLDRMIQTVEELYRFGRNCNELFAAVNDNERQRWGLNIHRHDPVFDAVEACKANPQSEDARFVLKVELGRLIEQAKDNDYKPNTIRWSDFVAYQRYLHMESELLKGDQGSRSPDADS